MARVKPCRLRIASTVAGPCNKCRTRESPPCAYGAGFKQEKGTSREAHVAVRLAALGRLPQRVEMGKRGNRRPESDAIVAKATDLCKQRNAYQRVLVGIDLGHGVHDAAGPARFPLVLPDASSSGAPVVAVERSRGSNLPRRSTRSRSGRSSRKRCTMLLIFSLLLCSSDGTTHVLHQDPLGSVHGGSRRHGCQGTERLLSKAASSLASQVRFAFGKDLVA